MDEQSAGRQQAAMALTSPVDNREAATVTGTEGKSAWAAFLRDFPAPAKMGRPNP
jgi:hypothetical protein